MTVILVVHLVETLERVLLHETEKVATMLQSTEARGSLEIPSGHPPELLYYY